MMIAKLFGLEIEINVTRAGYVHKVIRAVNQIIPPTANSFAAKIERIKIVRKLGNIFPDGTIDKYDHGTVSLVAAKEFVEKYWSSKIAA